MEQKIRAILIIEVAGRPPEYLSEAIKEHINKLNFIKGVRVVNSSFAAPRKIDEEKDLYTAFSETEIETDSLQKLLDVVFEFMPSSVEILDPEEVVFNIQETTNFFNDLAARLHKYDDLAKIAKFQIQELSQRLQKAQQQMVAPNVIQPVKITSEAPKQDKKIIKKSKKSKKK